MSAVKLHNAAVLILFLVVKLIVYDTAINILKGVIKISKMGLTATFLVLP